VKRWFCSSFALVVALAPIADFASALAADILFESGTLGPTGIPRIEIANGSNVSPVVFVGVRIYLNQPVSTCAMRSVNTLLYLHCYTRQ
jgi:hypothetical protein